MLQQLASLILLSVVATAYVSPFQVGSTETTQTTETTTQSDGTTLPPVTENTDPESTTAITLDQPAVVTPEQCGALVETYSIVPMYTWGSAPQQVQDAFVASCLTQICHYYADKYKIVPNVGWGDATDPVAFKDVQQAFSHPSMNCRDIILKNVSANPTCGQIYEDFGLVPAVEWGTTPYALREMWLTNVCEVDICFYWAQKFNIVIGQVFPPETPMNVRQSWSDPLMNCRSKINPSAPAATQ